MCVVSCRLLACRRPISSRMLTSASSALMCLSSSILASSSAIGCSKSRKATAICAGYRFTLRLLRLRAPRGIRKALGRACRRCPNEAQLHGVTTDETLEGREQLARRPHAPFVAQRSAPQALAVRYCDRHRACPGAHGLRICASSSKAPGCRIARPLAARCAAPGSRAPDPGPAMRRACRRQPSMKSSKRRLPSPAPAHPSR